MQRIDRLLKKASSQTKGELALHLALVQPNGESWKVQAELWNGKEYGKGNRAERITLEAGTLKEAEKLIEELKTKYGDQDSTIIIDDYIQTI